MPDEQSFETADKEGRVPALDLGDLIQDGAYEDSASSTEVHLSAPGNQPSSLPYPMTEAQVPSKPRMIIPATKHVPPPPSQIRRDPLPATLQSVVHPPKETCSNLPIMFPSIPPGGTKSRVETQVRLTVDLAHASASSGEPLKYDRVGSWKWLRLPKGTSTKRRTRKEGIIDASPEDTLHLTTEITCASPPHTKVTCCSSCQAREAKRIERKLAARVRPARSDDESGEEPLLIPGRGKHEDTSKLIQFNCPEVLEFSTGTVVLPLRITCYCRHHREKTGFNVHFAMYDHSGRLVGSGITRPIMITDDHKSTGVNKAATSSASQTPEFEWPVRSLGDHSDVASSPPTKRKGRNQPVEAKKRTKPYDGRRNIKLSRKTSNGSLNSAIASAFTTRPSTPALSPAGSSADQLQTFEPATPDFSDNAVAAPIASSLSPLIAPPIIANESHAFDDILMPDVNAVNSAEASLGVMSQTNFLLDISSSVSPSMQPHDLMDIPISQPTELAQPLQYLFHSEPPPIPNLPTPKIHRLIPATGPTYGGVEITILGGDFHPNMQLNCVFGDAHATSTQRWSDNTLVCLLPPSPTPGVVSVWFDGIPKEEGGSPPALFVYTDETDRALMELALQVVGLKMTGKIEDARDVAMRIVNTTGPDNMNNNVTNVPSGLMQLASSSRFSADLLHLLSTRSGEVDDFEKLILDFLTVLDTPLAVPTHSIASTISHTTASGQTMLHLASFLGFRNVVQFLLAHHIDFDARDKNGYTALHLAVLKNSSVCARLLIEAGAALDIVNALGKTAAEIAPSGFFKELFAEDPSADDEDSESDWTDGDSGEEAAWGDVEVVSEDDKRAALSRRRKSSRKLLSTKEKPSHKPSTTRPVTSSEDEDIVARPLPAKKAKEAGSVDEKQIAASIMDMVQRTFAQIQHPQGMMPNFPLQLPGIPAWGALPQMPAAFPVFVPMPAFWGERRSEGTQSADEGDRVPKFSQWRGIPTAQEWKAMWERWAMYAKPTEEAPPAYTPRSTEEVEKPKVELAEASTSTATTTSTRRVCYEVNNMPEREVESFGYRPVKQARKQQKKHDRMLILFWVPALLIGLLWALMHPMQKGLQAVMAVLSIKAGLRA